MAKDKTASEPTKPSLGVVVNDLGDGTSAIHGIEADGTEHQIVMANNHGQFLSFKALIADWLTRLGQRATTWDKQVPAATPPAPEEATDGKE